MNIKMIKHRILIAWKALISNHVILISMDQESMEGMMIKEEEVYISINTAGHSKYTQMRTLQGVYDSYVEPNIKIEEKLFLKDINSMID